MKAYFHIFSNGQKADIVFNTTEDKIYGMNSIPICTLEFDIKILVFIINDTHFHIVAYGTEECINSYCNRLKTRIGRGINTVYPLQIYTLKINDTDHLKRAFMYVYRNSLDFGKTLPWNYPWGVGNIFFRRQQANSQSQKIKILQKREQSKLFKTKINLPSEWIIDNKGVILPESYIDIKMVENIFISPRAFIAFLFIRKDDEVAMKQMFISQKLELRSIQELREIGNQIAREQFGKESKFINYKNKLQVATSMIKQSYACKNVSLAKALYLSIDDLELI